MVSTDKLIKVGVQYTDKYFEDVIQLYIRAYKDSMSLEEFLDETSDYSIGNPLEANGYKDTLTNLIVASTNDIRFSRPAQKALMNNIIRQTTGELITNVGDDVKSSVRDIVRRGYNTGTLSHQNVAKEITSTLEGINKKRARTIARTEIKRAQTTSNYMVAKERGANAYKYKCGAEPCDICKKDCGEVFSIDDLEHLPPRHPNCMCGVTFVKDPDMPDAEPNTDNTEENIEDSTPQTSSLKVPKDYSKLADKHNLEILEPSDEHYIYRNINDNSLLKFQKTMPAKEVSKYLEDYNSMPRLLKGNVGEITFLNKSNRSELGLYFPDTNSIEIHTPNLKQTYAKNYTSIRNPLAHEMAHALDHHSKTSLLGKEFSSKKIWQNAMMEDAKRFKELGVEDYYGKGKNKIMFRPYAGKNVNHELFWGTERTVAMEDLADSIGVQFMKKGEKTLTGLGYLSKEEWNSHFPNRAKIAKEIINNPSKYGLDNYLKEKQSTTKNLGTTDSIQDKLTKLENKVSRNEKSVKKFSKIDKKIENHYRKQLDKSKKELADFKKKNNL